MHSFVQKRPPHKINSPRWQMPLESGIIVLWKAHILHFQLIQTKMTSQKLNLVLSRSVSWVDPTCLVFGKLQILQKHKISQ